MTKKKVCGVCGVEFLPKDPAKWYTYTGYKSKHFCSDECWQKLASEAAYDTGKQYENGGN